LRANLLKELSDEMPNDTALYRSIREKSVSTTIGDQQQQSSVNFEQQQASSSSTNSLFM
jgi:hypothetical protein